MREGALRIDAVQPPCHFVAQNEGAQHGAPAQAPLLGDGQHPRQDVRRRLKAVRALAQFHRPRGDAVQQRRRADVGLRQSGREDRGAATRAQQQPLA
jgi:hypothetical protein